MSKKECRHKDVRPSYEYVTCRSCGSIRTDQHRSWGIAKGKWFESLDMAEFYKKNGSIPEAI